MANQLVRFALSDRGATAALGVNVTDSEVTNKVVAGATGLIIKDSISIGGVASDKSGNLYVTDPSRHVVLKITQGGEITTLAGLAGTSGRNGTLTNVAPTTARFNTPMGIDVDNSGRIYVADMGNNQIRVIDTNGYVSVLAGNGSGTSGFADGVGGAATFNSPVDVAVDASGTVWVCDMNNHSIRRIKGGTVYTFAGSESGDGENVAATTRALFSYPRAIAVNKKQEIFVADTGNVKIKKITPKGYVYLHSGSGSTGRTLGTAYTSTYNEIWSLAVDASDYLYAIDIAEDGDSRVLRVNARGIPSVVADFAAGSYGSQLAGVAIDQNQRIFVAMSSQTSRAFSSSSSSSVDSSSSSSSSA